MNVSYTLMWWNQKLRLTHPDGTQVVMMRRELIEILNRHEYLYTERKECYTIHGVNGDYEIEVGVI